MRRIVIVGNGIAAAGCIEGVRSQDQEAEITVVSQERRHVYCRPLISYYLAGKTDLERIQYRPESFYKDNRCRVLMGRRAVRLDPKERTVELDGGTALPYDALCVAAGSAPFTPPMDGLETVERKFEFMTLDDALALEQALTERSRVLIAGAGMIGLKCAEGIAQRAGSVAVCDLADRILSSIMDGPCAAMVQRRLEENGVRFYLSDCVSRFDGGTAFLRSGERVDFDILVLAVGVRPCTALVKEAGGEVNRGIVTTPRMETTLPGVYAAGDCVESFDVASQGKKVLAVFANAYLQGRCAGTVMAGGEAEFDRGIAMNSVGFFGLHAMTAGSCFDPEQEVYEQASETGIKKLFTKDGFLAGFMLVGSETERAGIYTALIRNRTPLETIDWEMIRRSPSLLPFGAEIRGKKLGGVV